MVPLVQRPQLASVSVLEPVSATAPTVVVPLKVSGVPFSSVPVTFNPISVVPNSVS